MSNKFTKREDHKKERAATRQVLDGGHFHNIRSDSWSHRIEQAPLPDDAIVTSKKKKGGCKKSHGGLHVAETQKTLSHYQDGGPFGRRAIFRYRNRCKFCGKIKWRDGKGWL